MTPSGTPPELSTMISTVWKPGFRCPRLYSWGVEMLFSEPISFPSRNNVVAFARSRNRKTSFRDHPTGIVILLRYQAFPTYEWRRLSLMVSTVSEGSLPFPARSVVPGRRMLSSNFAPAVIAPSGSRANSQEPDKSVFFWHEDSNMADAMIRNGRDLFIRLNK